jgi:hypothetical protein
MAEQARLRKSEIRFRAEQEYRRQNGFRDDHAADPAREANADPAPTRHAPYTEGQRTSEKSKYAASEVFRSKKGDRLS